MKPNFSEMARLRRRLPRLSLCAGLVLAQLTGRGTEPLYYNDGVVTVPPQIDATNFVNDGTFNISTPVPFDTSGTLNFTNNGTMSGSVGFRFDHAPPNSGQRTLASTFINTVSGTIEAVDDFGGTLGGSKLFVAATNVINRGLLQVGQNGWLQLVGTNVDLYRSGLGVPPLLTGSIFGSRTNLGTNFTADTGILDQYWAQTNMTLDSSALLSGFGTNITAQWPAHRVSSGGFGSFTIPPHTFVSPVSDFITSTNNGIFINVTDEQGLVTTNVFVPTNITRQAAFVDMSGASNMTVAIRWSNSSIPSNSFDTVSVGLAVPVTNVVTASSLMTTVYFVDRLAGEATRGLSFNSSAGTFRPAPYSISRGAPIEFLSGVPGNGPVTNTTFLYDPQFTNPVVTAAYAAYDAFVDSVVKDPVSLSDPGATVTNLPGRITIYAKNLNMSRTRLQGLGLVRIQADHLVSSSNAVVDSESLSYDLSSTNGTLRIQDLARESVERLKGEVAAWSGVWSNRLALVIPNFRTNATSGGWTSAPTIVNVQMGLHALMLNAAALVTHQPVTVYTLNTHSTNTVVNDAMTVVQSLLFDGQSLTLNGRLTLSSATFTPAYGDPTRMALDNWVFTNAPNLRYFTNNGTFTVPNVAHFGDDGPAPYAAFVNAGAIYANGQSINSDYCEISGQHIATASISVTNRSGKVMGGRITAGADVHLFGNVMKFDHSTISAGHQLDLSVTSSLYDDGGSASNVWTCRDGFRLNLKPEMGGDLLGTAIQTRAPQFAEVDHFWAGTDRGATIQGYSNNTALGKLTLVPEGADPLFVFSGTGASNGLYVDYLDLSYLTDFQNQLQINPNLVIYFAAAKLGFTPPLTNGVPQEPEEYLDGQFGGHLRWVHEFAGPNSAVDVVVQVVTGSETNFMTTSVNRAVRFSRIIDSDGDGIPNFYDLDPFLPQVLVPRAALVETNASPFKTLSVSWEAAPQTVYQVEYTTNLPPANWQVLLKYTNNATAFRTVTVLDTNAPAAGNRRFYRVGQSH